MLFNEPKLLKSTALPRARRPLARSFSALQRAEIAEIAGEDKNLLDEFSVSVLFNEPKLLKSPPTSLKRATRARFSALQRAEIAEILVIVDEIEQVLSFSALQRAEIAEITTRAGLSSGKFVFQCSSTSRNC